MRKQPDARQLDSVLARRATLAGGERNAAMATARFAALVWLVAVIVCIGARRRNVDYVKAGFTASRNFSHLSSSTVLTLKLR
jgi:hypothetical protein